MSSLLPCIDNLVNSREDLPIIFVKIFFHVLQFKPYLNGYVSSLNYKILYFIDQFWLLMLTKVSNIKSINQVVNNDNHFRMNLIATYILSVISFGENLV